MASSNRRTIRVQRQVPTEHRYFLITLTNHPNVLQRTQQFQQLPSQVCARRNCRRQQETDQNKLVFYCFIALPTTITTSGYVGTNYINSFRNASFRGA